MRKVLKDTKSLLLENMVKLNPDFQLKEEDKNWIQNAVIPNHNGINEAVSSYGYDNDEIKEYQIRVERLKAFMDELIKTEEYDVIDTLYRLLIDRKHKAVGSPLVAENHSPEMELLKDKINEVIGQLLPYKNEPKHNK